MTSLLLNMFLRSVRQLVVLRFHGVGKAVHASQLLTLLLWLF